MRNRTAVIIALGLSLLSSTGRAAGDSAEALSAVDPGDWVELELLPDGGQGWATREVDLKGRPKNDGGSVVGPFERTGDGGAVLGLRFDITPETSVKDTLGENIAAAEVATGEIVEVRLVRESGRFRARKIRRVAPETSYEIEGVVENVSTANPPALRILGVEVTTLGDVRVRRLNKRPRFIRLADDDDPIPASRISAGPFSIGATATFEVDPERNYDLNRDRARDLAESTVSSRLEITGRVSDAVRVFAKGGYRQRFILEDQRNRRTGFGDWELAEGYLLFLGILRPEFVLQVGRQDFDDAHEWLYDENLDAVRLHYLGSRVHGEVSVSSRLDDAGPRLHGRWNAGGALTVAVTPDVSAGGWVLRSRPRSGEPDVPLTWFGARLLSAKVGGFRGWGEFAAVTGRDGDRRVRGSAFHVSGSRIISRSSRLALNAAWARGSGDRNLSDETDTMFRQTGFQDNNDRFQGVTSFRYYGELLDPELSNLDVKTLGLGVRPLADTSLDLVVHRIHQVDAAPFLRNANLDIRPSGLSADIGTEIDLVAGFRRVRNLKIEWVLGVLQAGRAFPDETESALMTHLQVDIGF